MYNYIEFLSGNVNVGGNLFLSKGQNATIMCIAKTKSWTYTLRKLLVMVYSDEFLSTRCAVGKKGAKHLPIYTEEIGSIKGNVKNNFSKK